MGTALRQRIQQDRFESPVQEALLNLMVAAAYVREQAEKVCEPHGITASQYNVLRILRGVHPEGHPRCEVARRMVDRAPDVTRLVDRLERQGLVERDRSDRDRRLSITRITSAGLEVLARMEPEMQVVNHAFAERVSVEDGRELSRICEGIYSGAEEHEPGLEDCPEQGSAGSAG
ncbi:MAG: MarR family transcriptional regulator [Acidobacteriota bacterium]|nr:MarR family transcriptional regulator [Acidobacteriota bacterium]